MIRNTTILPTLSFSRIGDQLWDIVVVGGGPAGALSAQLLAREGLAVLLVDRAQFPRWKVCGCCLTARGQAILNSTNLAHLLNGKNHIVLREMILASGFHQAHLPLPGWIAISRETLDAEIIQSAIGAGAHFLPSTNALLGPTADENRQVVLNQDKMEIPVRAKLILAADGLGGQFLHGQVGSNQKVLPSSRIGMGTVAEEVPDFYTFGTVYMACGREGYLGMVRLADGRLDLAAALDRKQVRNLQGPAGVVCSLLQKMNWPSLPGLFCLRWRGTPSLTRKSTQLGASRVLTLGDAAGYVEPFTGEGMTWALGSATAIVPLALKAVQRWSDSLVAEWSTLHERTVSNRQMACKVLARTLRHPGLIRVLVTVLNRLPGLSTPLVRYINGA